jgi:hypothetical protein
MVFLVVTYLPLLVVGIDLVQHYVIKFFIDLRQVCWFPPGIPVSSTDKIDYHDITEIVESGIKHHDLPSILYVSGSPTMTLPVLCSNLPHLSISLSIYILCFRISHITSIVF